MTHKSPTLNQVQSCHLLSISRLLCILLLTSFSLSAVAGENSGLTLPKGFSAKILADNLGRARNIVVTPEHTLYVRLGDPVNGEGMLVLQESGGVAKKTSGFGNYGGTGLFLKDNYLYTSSDDDVFRYKLDKKHQLIDPNKPEKIVTGLVNKGSHSTKSLVVDNRNNVYVNIGAPSNACQEQDRQKGSPGMKNCPLLERSGGIWQFKADKKDQSYAEGTRYATGLRNVVGLDWNQDNDTLYVMQHGRDQLHALYPEYYSVKQSAILPAEALYALKKGDNAGWPYMYYDQTKNKKMLMPEYGGDGKKEAVGKFIDPDAAFPGHLAPNGLKFYAGKQFPKRYRNGAFIAFHGSWNRSPEPQAGFFVAFQPYKNGKAHGDWEIFADGFSGSPQNTATGQADRRPCGLALGPDGSLYVTDDKIGTIYKISYKKS